MSKYISQTAVVIGHFRQLIEHNRNGNVAVCRFGFIVGKRNVQRRFVYLVYDDFGAARITGTVNKFKSKLAVFGKFHSERVDVRHNLAGGVFNKPFRVYRVAVQYVFVVFARLNRLIYYVSVFVNRVNYIRPVCNGNFFGRLQNHYDLAARCLRGAVFKYGCGRFAVYPRNCCGSSSFNAFIISIGKRKSTVFGKSVSVSAVVIRDCNMLVGEKIVERYGNISVCRLGSAIYY